MFTNIVATGDYAWASSSEVLLDHNIGVDGNQHANVEQADLKKGSGDSEEDGIPNFADDVFNMVRGICLPVATAAVVGKERKENSLRFKLGKKKEF